MNEDKPKCVRCTKPATGPCCSSHNKLLCHLDYRRTHFVEVCVPGCRKCAAEGLPVKLSELSTAGGVMSKPAVAYISIGNSDDKLSQAEWHRYYVAVNLAIHRAAEAPGGKIHGQWVSEPASAWQNACWALQLPADVASVEHLKMRLAELAADFRQDSIAWAVAPETEFIGAEAVA